MAGVPHVKDPNPNNWSDQFRAWERTHRVGDPMPQQWQGLNLTSGTSNQIVGNSGMSINYADTAPAGGQSYTLANLGVK